MSRFQTRRERRAADRALDDALPPRQWLLRALIPYAGVVAFLFALQAFGDNPHMGVPIAATSIFWGMSIAIRYLRRQQRALGDGEQQEQRQKLETPAPVPAAVPARAVPESVADIAELVARVSAGLRRHNQERLAGRLEEGVREVVRLASLADATGPEEQSLREEITRLNTRAEATADAEAADLWRTNARSAERRLEKVVALAAAADRTQARIESFRQTVKSLAVDLARLDLASEDPTMLTAVDQHAASLERDVEALSRTHSELAGLERAAGPNMAAQAARAGQRTV